MKKIEKNYALGTHDQEINRLGLQNEVWRETVLECWKVARIKKGFKVLDVGAGPGYASFDLAEIVGKKGKVVAIERSNRFVNYAEGIIKSKKIKNIIFQEMDLMTGSIEEKNFDASWCRWVAAFVSNPEKLISDLSGALKIGGKAIFHEYVNYRSFGLIPERQIMKSFVDEVVKNWNESGGEPNVALVLPTLLKKHGFKITHTKPIIFSVNPKSKTWQWPASFIKIHIDYLLKLGRVSKVWRNKVARELNEAEKNPSTIMMTPMVLEIIAEKIK